MAILLLIAVNHISPKEARFLEVFKCMLDVSKRRGYDQFSAMSDVVLITSANIFWLKENRTAIPGLVKLGGTSPLELFSNGSIHQNNRVFRGLAH